MAKILSRSLLVLAAVLTLCGAASSERKPVRVVRGPTAWRSCHMQSPGYTGTCRMTRITSGLETTNIHFSVDDDWEAELNFILLGEWQEPMQENLDFTLVMGVFETGQPRVSPGRCSLRPEALRCISNDRQFQAEAAGPLR